jgi:hypothetical protein
VSEIHKEIHVPLELGTQWQRVLGLASMRKRKGTHGKSNLLFIKAGITVLVEV